MEDCKNLDNSIDDKKISFENFKPTENNQSLKNLPKLRRESNNSTCSVASIITSDNGENVQSCGSVCVFNLQQKLIFNCEFCDLKYGDLDNFRRHLHEAHNLFQHEEKLANGNNAPTSSKISTIVKKEPLEPPIDLPSSYFTEPLVSCGSAFILNQEKFLLGCGYCNCSKYEILDMFEKHIKQQHNILEGSHNELNVVPKVEVKEEEFIDIKLEEAAEIKQNFSEEEGEDENEFLDEDDDGEYKEEPEDDEESEDQQSTSENSKRKRNVSPSMTSSSSSNKSKKTKKQLDEPSENPEVECEICHKRLKRRSLNNHREIHMGESRKIHNCQKCDKKFLRPRDLKQHMTIHTGEKPFTCDICNYRYRSKRGLHLHKQLHLGESENNFQCKYCEKKLSSYENLRIHLRTHIGKGHFKCDICHKRFHSSYYLKSHKIKHTGEAGRVHSCEHCDKKFFLRAELLTHIHVHTGELSYKCDICYISFQTHEKLSEHKKGRHIEQVERIFNCQHCDKKFKRAYGLKVNLRTHTGEKPYKCEICHKRFGDNGNFFSHKKKHTNDAKNFNM